MNKFLFMPTPKMYDWYHMMWVFIVIISAIIVLALTRKNDKKQTKTFLTVYLITMWVGELVKQVSYAAVGNWGTNFIWEYPWVTFPFQFCTTALYVTTVAMIFLAKKKEKAYQTTLTYLATFSLFSGLIVVIYPADVFREKIATNIQTFVQHGMMFLFGLHILKSGQIGTFKDFFRACYLFVIFITIALILNVALYDASNGIINLFFVSPYHESIFPVIGKLYQINFLLYIFVVILLISFAAFTFYIIGRYIKYPLKYIKKGISFSLRNPWGKYVLLGSFILVNLITSLCFLSINKSPSVVFPLVPFSYHLNGALVDILFLIIIISFLFAIVKNKKARAITLVIIGVIIQTLFIANAIHGENFQYYITRETLNLAGNPTNLGITLEFIFMCVCFFFEYKMFFAYIPTLVFVLLLLMYQKENKDELTYYKNSFTEKVVLGSFIKEKPSTKFLSKNKQVIKSFSFVLVFGIFLVFTSSANYLVKSSKIYSGNYNTKPIIKGKITTSILAFLGEENYQKDEPLDLDILKKYDRNPNKLNRLDDYGNPISNELSGVENFNNLNEIKPLFKDKNIYFIQMETFPSILLAQEKDNIFHNYVRNFMPDFFSIYDNSYRLNNFYSTTGFGVSSDANFTTITGNYAPGGKIQQVAGSEKRLKIDYSLPKILKQEKGYDSISFVGMDYIFYNEYLLGKEVYGYNRSYFMTENKHLDSKYKLTIPKKGEKDTHQNMFLCQDIVSNNDYDNIKLKYNSYDWAIDDKYLFKIAGELYKDYPQKHFMFLETQYPHTPFLNIREEDRTFTNYYKPALTKDNKLIPEEDYNDFQILNKKAYQMNNIDYNMFSYYGLINRYFKSFIENILPYRKKDSVFIFYGDHCHNAFKKKSHTVLYEKEKSFLEYRQDMSKVAAFVYIPNGNLNPNDRGVYPGLLKGIQENIRSQKDIYGTILEMLDIEIPTYTLYNNLFTNAKGIAIDTRHFLVFTDYFIANAKFPNDKLFWLKENQITKEKALEIIEEQRKIKNIYEQIALSGDYSILIK